jgi:hypothetical protein
MRCAGNAPAMDNATTATANLTFTTALSITRPLVDRLSTGLPTGSRGTASLDYAYVRTLLNSFERVGMDGSSHYRSIPSHAGMLLHLSESCGTGIPRSASADASQ